MTVQNFLIVVPLANLAVSGILSALIALVFDLEKLVEFMSIGTLLAYTIVSASVIILRYKPEVVEEQKPSKEGDDVSIITSSTQSDGFDVSRAGRLKPEFWWLSSLVGGRGLSGAIPDAVCMFTCLSAAFFVHVYLSGNEIVYGEWWAITTLVFLSICLIACLLIISAHHQNAPTGTFRVPWVPLIPGLSILCNVGLMVYLHRNTWIRFMVWMTLGLLVYFLYGIRHSKESEATAPYSMLMTSSEASKGPWGTMNPNEEVTGRPVQSELQETPTDMTIHVKKVKSKIQKGDDNEALIDDESDND